MKRLENKKRIFTWFLEIFTLAVAILVIIARFHPNNLFFSLTLCGQNLCLLILSFWAWIFLAWIVQEVKLIAKIHFSRQDVIVIMIVLAIILVYYTYSILTRQFIYYWDYAHYYRKQLGLSVDFQASGFFTSLIDVIKSIWYQDYSKFISIFLAAPFAFTPQTANWFVATCAITILPMLYWGIAIFIKVLDQILQPKRSEFFFIGSMVLAAGFPLIHRSLLYGQPDLFGLILAFLILIITIQYDFSKTDLKRYLIIIALTIMIVASRRWYMFWVVAYYVCYVFAVMLRILLNKDWCSLKRLLQFCLSAAVIIAIVLFPMILRILRADYAGHYSYYNIGGFPVELKRQLQYLGLGLMLTFLVGFLFGIIRKRTRAISILTIVNGLLLMLIFTRIQNMGLHHMLVLVPTYYSLMLLCLAAISFIKEKWIFQLSIVLFLGFHASNAVLCGVTSSNAKIPAMFSRIALELPRRDDIEQIEAVNRWIIENCSESEYVYMIPHGDLYNPDVFRSSNLPDGSVSSRLPYGSAILGTHSFPEGLLLAKYVLTCEPFCNASIAEKYNLAFLSEIPQKHFVEIKHFDMGTGYTFFAYQRVLPTDCEEILFYKAYFSEEDELYPEMFSGILNELLKNLS